LAARLSALEGDYNSRNPTPSLRGTILRASRRRRSNPGIVAQRSCRKHAYNVWFDMEMESGCKMKKRCLACGVEKDTEVKECYPHPEDGVIDDPTNPLFDIDCQGGNDWRKAVVCHECFHRLDPDQWISEACWQSLKPMIPFEKLPRL
jgi:hypothetical protein